MRAPLPPAGYLPLNPCAAAGPAGGPAGGPGGGGGGFGGGGGNAGPYVAPGTYTVSLVADGKVIDTKPMRITMDPEVTLTVAARAAYDKVVTDLHEVQGRGNAMAGRLNTLGTQIAIVKSKLDSTASVSEAAKTQLVALEKAFDAQREKFGVAAGRVPGPPAPGAAGGGPGGGPGGGGGGFGGGAANPANALGRVSTAKGALVGVWEVPSPASLTQASSATAALEAAMREAVALFSQAGGVNDALKPSGLALQLP